MFAQKQIEAAARAILDRRSQSDFGAIDNGRWRYDYDKELAVAALEAADAAAWEPIKTAPKDGSLIFLWNELWDGCCGPIVCWWDDIHDCWTTYTTTIKKWADQPTHWRQLPSPPEEK